MAGLRGILLVLVCAVAPGPAAGQGFPAAPPVVRRVPAGPDTGLVPVVPPPGDWVEEPREVPVDPAVAESLARVAVRGGHGAAGPWLLLGGALWGPALAAWGAWAAHWAAAQAPGPPPHAGARAWAAAVAPAVWWAAALVAWGPLVAAGALAGAAATAGTALALARWQGSAGAPVVAGAALAAAGGALAGALLGGTAWLLARELGARALVAWTWEHVHPTPAAGAPPPPARPLDPDRRGRFLAVVAAGRLADAAWWDAVPVVGPWLGAAATRRALKEDLYAARELAGMPRIVDTLQREVDAVAWARAAAASSAWVLLPAAAGLAAAGGLLLGAGPGALPAWAWAAGWGGLAAGAGVALAAAAAAWGTALLLEALAPWWLARAAAAGGVTPSLDRRLTAGRQAPRPRAGWGGRGV